MFRNAILRFHEEKKKYKKRFINLLPVIHLGLVQLYQYYKVVKDDCHFCHIFHGCPQLKFKICKVNSFDYTTVFVI